MRLRHWSSALTLVVCLFSPFAAFSQTPTVSSLTLSQSSVSSGDGVLGVVSLSGPAPTGGAPVALASSDRSAATVPATITVPAGATAAGFTVRALTVAVAEAVTVTAVYNATNHTAPLDVTPSPTLSGLTLAAPSALSATTVTATVRLNAPAPAGGAAVALTSSDTGVATVPASITVAFNATTATFTVTAKTVVSASSAAITATRNGVSRQVSVRVTPTVAAALLSLNPVSVVSAGHRRPP